MGRDERRPRDLPLSLRRWFDAVVFEDVADGLVGNGGTAQIRAKIHAKRDHKLTFRRHLTVRRDLASYAREALARGCRVPSVRLAC